MLRGCIALLFATIAVAATPIQNAPSQHAPPAKVQAVDTERGNASAANPKASTSEPLLHVEAHVTGSLNTHSTEAQQSGQTEGTKWTDPIVLFTFLLVLVGAATACILFNTDRSTAKNAAAALKAANAASANTDMLRTQMRANVFGMPKGAALAADNKTITIYVDLENSGQTPAYNCIGQWAAGIKKHPLSAPVTVEEGDLGRTASTVIYAQKSHATTQTITLTDADLTLINEETHALYVYGAISYTDAFHEDQASEFCLFLDKGQFYAWRERSRAEPRKAILPIWKVAQFNNTAKLPKKNPN
jgi:hypothetical protein